ncbi:MAG: class I SAM-dependent methyltransferase [Deltaproteobacteria bacterium]|nr:class I SAM-dependent methyltransferase [Deltaproteobacteria bacterium]
MTTIPEWNDRYVTDDLPWETGRPSTELVRILNEYQIPRGRALEIGCGSGNNAVYLAQQGFEVTAFDLSAKAVEMAQTKIKNVGVHVRLLTADLSHLPDLGAPYPFVFDRGVYHTARQGDLGLFIKVLKQYCVPGGYYLTIAGNKNEVRSGERGPPRVTAEEICHELLGIMELVQLKEMRFDQPLKDTGLGRALGWSAFFRRKK